MKAVRGYGTAPPWPSWSGNRVCLCFLVFAMPLHAARRDMAAAPPCLSWRWAQFTNRMSWYNSNHLPGLKPFTVVTQTIPTKILYHSAMRTEGNGSDYVCRRDSEHSGAAQLVVVLLCQPRFRLLTRPRKPRHQPLKMKLPPETV